MKNYSIPFINVRLVKAIANFFSTKGIHAIFFQKTSLTLLIFVLICSGTKAQIVNTGCVTSKYGIDAGLFTDVLEYGEHGSSLPGGTNDWFFTTGGTGFGVIDESNTASLKALLQAGNNPSFVVDQSYDMSSIINGHILIDGLWARDKFGGTGHTDPTSFSTASKNGEDPAIWDPGAANVLGKNDLIDVAGHMWREGTTLQDDLWFVGLINRAEPGGSAYMDFEFFVEDVTYNASTGFSSGGDQLGHTAFEFDASGKITKVGDIILNISLVNGGETPEVEVRIWVSYSDYSTITPAAGTFTWGSEYDGAFTGSPYGYASIVVNSEDACGIVNKSGETPAAPPWGTQGTKSNNWHDTYAEFSVVEIGLNMTTLGIDHSSLVGLDPCDFPLSTFIVKSRASASFTAQLKDFAGPFSWGNAFVETDIVGNPLISCDNPIVTLISDPVRTDATYLWTTINGNILTDPASASINVDRPGTYTLSTTLTSTNCSIEDVSRVVSYDPAKPFFNDLTVSTTAACYGQTNGTVDITVSGGTAPYSYAWSNSATTKDLTGLAAGTYTVVITDALGCTQNGSATVSAGTETVIALTPTHLTCNGNGTGAINATVSGNSPFTYSWSNGITSEDINGLSSGSYTLTTTDADGCTKVASVTVNQPTTINLSVSKTNETAPPNNDGTINLTVSGGTSPYTFAWSNSATTEDINGLSAGSYSVTVTDANGCTASISTSILEPEICNDGIDNDGDGLTDCQDSECIPSNPGTITASKNPVCVGDTGITYSITDVGAESYTWTVPSGATITNGQGTTTITVTWSSNVGGKICVTSANGTCTSAASSCFDVDLNDIPPAPSDINVTGL